MDEAAPVPATVMPEAPARQRWTVGFALAANGIATTLPLVTLGLLLPAITATFGLSDTQAGWLGGVTTAGYLLITLPAAVLFSRANPYSFTMVSVSMVALFTALHGAAPNFFLLLLARLGFSLSFALRPASQALVIQRWFPTREVPLVQGVIMAMLGAAEFIVLLLTPKVLEVTGSWRTVYVIYGLAAMAVAGFWAIAGRGGGTAHFMRAEAPAIHTGGSLADLRRVLRYREVWIVGIGMFTSGLSWWAFGTFWPTFLLERYGIPLHRSGFLYGLTSLAMVPSCLALGYLGSRIRSRRMVLGVAGLTLGLTSVGSLVTGNFWLLAILSTLAGVAWGYTAIGFAVPFEIPGIRPPEVAMSSSVITVFMMSGGIAGPAMVGTLADMTGSLFLALMVSACIPFTMAVVVLWLRDSQNRSTPDVRSQA